VKIPQIKRTEHTGSGSAVSCRDSALDGGYKCQDDVMDGAQEMCDLVSTVTLLSTVATVCTACYELKMQIVLWGA
jgi:hypothetical protein